MHGFSWFVGLCMSLTLTLLSGVSAQAEVGVQAVIHQATERWMVYDPLTIKIIELKSSISLEAEPGQETAFTA